MKIISWNCNMAFRKKWSGMTELDPDILVIQECEHPSKYKSSEEIPNCNEFLWFGDNQNKGIGILSFNNYKLVATDNYDAKYKYIIPIEITKNDTTILAFIIWAMPDKTRKSDSYVGQIWNAINHYDLDNEDRQIILIGDWNSNAQWDKSRPQGNHSMCVELLANKDIVSVYHELTRIPHGNEPDPTLYLLKNKNKPYHMDYCFLSKNMITEKTEIEIGKYDDWIESSDHMPVIVNNLKG